MPQISQRVRNIASHGMAGWQVYLSAIERSRAGEDILFAAIGDHDFPTPDPIVEACVEAVRAGHHHYTDLAGLPELRAAMAAIASQSTGVPTKAEEVLVTPGGQPALFCAASAALEPGDHAIVLSPYYATFPGTFAAVGAEFSIVDCKAEDGFQPDAAAIEAATTERTKAVLINTPNNPSGAIFTRERLEQIAALCQRRDWWLISDEVYWSLADGDHLSPRSLPGMTKRTLVVTSLSKSHAMTGWRVGWLTGPTDAIAALTELSLVSTYGICDFISHAAASALGERQVMADIAGRYRHRREHLRGQIEAIDGLAVAGSSGGMYLLVDVRAVDADDERFAWTLLDDHQLAVMPGRSFGVAAAGHVRLSLCQPEDQLTDVARRIADCVASYDRSAKPTRRAS